MPITCLVDFYAEMRLLCEIRRKIVSDIVSGQKVDQEHFEELLKIENRLLSIPKKNSEFQLKTNLSEHISLELDYELGELMKDRIYLEKGEKALQNHLKAIHKNFEAETESSIKFLKNQSFDHFITDRDGTVSNYCGRYQSSIQSIYNALYLSSFSKVVKGKSIILTSAPLFHIGLAEMSVQPQQDFILAGSKGRELVDESGKKYNYPIEKDQQFQLDKLNEAIEELLKTSEFSSFRYIGSGLQYKFGQTTLARQDKNQSIPKDKSQRLKFEIQQLLKKLDPERKYFRLEDTGKDLEIMLTVESKNNKEVEDFNKGHGVKFIIDKLQMNTKNKKILICGDTASDLPMIDAANDLGANVSTVFVTTDSSLQQEVKTRCEHSHIVSTPDVLVTMLYKYAKNK